MRTQDSIDAWREVLELDARGLPRARGAREAVHAGGALGGGRSTSSSGARRPSRTRPSRSTCSCRRPRCGPTRSATAARRPRSTSACCRSTPGNQTASIELERLYRQRKSWVKLVDLLLARTEFAPDAPARIALLVQMAETYEQQLNDRDSAFVTLQAAFREDYSNDHVAKELERLATAADKWNELIGDYTQVVQGIARSQDGRRPVGQDRALVRLGAASHVDYAIASAQQALQLDNAHVGALQALEDFFRKQKKWGDLVAALARHAEVEQEPTAARRHPAAARRHLRDADRRRGAGDVRLPARARHRRALHRRHQRPRAPVPPHAGLGPPGRGAGEEVAGRRRHRAGDQAAAAGRRAVGGPPRRQRSRRRGLQGGPLRRPAEPAGPQGARHPVPEDRAHGGVPREPRAPARGLVARGRPRRDLPAHGHGLGGEQFAKPDRAAEVLEKILLIDDRNQKAYRDLERLYRARSASGSRWSTPTASTSSATNDANERIDLYTKMGQVYEKELRDLDRAIDAYNDVLNVEADHAEALAGLARLYEETEQWDRAVEIMRRLLRVSDRPQAEGRPQLPAGQDLRRADEGSGARPGVPGRGAVAGSGARAVDAVAAGHLQAARRLAEGGAAHGPRRGRPPSTRSRRRACCTTPPRSSRTSSATSSRPRTLYARVIAARSRARRGGRAAGRALLQAPGVGAAGARSSRCWPARPTARPTAS